VIAIALGPYSVEFREGDRSRGTLKDVSFPPLDPGEHEAILVEPMSLPEYENLRRDLQAEPERAFGSDGSLWEALSRPASDSFYLNGASSALHVGKAALAECLEYPFGQLALISLVCRKKRGLLIHGGCVTVAAHAFILAGVSGAGKSTLSLLLREHVAFRALTDERSILFSRGEKLFASGSPWSGTAGIAEPGEAPLGGTFFLQHADTNYLEDMSPTEAATELFRCSFPTFWYRPGMEFALEFCIRVAREVPCRRFGFRPDASAAEFLLKEIERA
jgi:hypothetical protein